MRKDSGVNVEDEVIIYPQFDPTPRVVLVPKLEAALAINKHATAHYKKTQHPCIKSFEPGENWRYCYIDYLFVE